MAAKYWLKLYHEILDDPKMGRLSDTLWRRVIELFLIAGETDKEGLLPPVGDMAWKLRVSTDELTAQLEELKQTGIISEEDAGWCVTNFARRQAPVSDAERMRRYRKRKRLRSGDDGVTDSVTIRNVDTDTDIDTDKREKEQSADAPVIFSEWQTVIKDAPNKVSALGYMFKTLYPEFYRGQCKPNYGFLGGLIKKYDDLYIAKLAWDNASRPPSGDPIRYVAGILSKKGNGQSTPPPVREAREGEYVEPSEFFN